jgi:hypothetical protein
MSYDQDFVYGEYKNKVQFEKEFYILKTIKRKVNFITASLVVTS